MRNSLVLMIAALFFLGFAQAFPAGAETLRPSSKHPAPADQAPSQDELRILEELKAEIEARLKKKAQPKADQAQGAKKEAPKEPPKPAKAEAAGSEQEQKPQAPPAKAEAAPKPAPEKTGPKADASPASGQKTDKAAPQTPPPPPAPEKQAEKAPSLGDAAVSEEPIKIVSNRLEADDKAMTVNFIGQVKAVQGETRMWCDKMVVHYTKEDTGAGQDVGMGDRKIRKIEVFGHVKVSKGDKVGTGQQGLFEFEEKRVVLWGKARLTQGKNTINGDKVILYLNDDRAVVEGGPQKVEAVLVPAKAPPKKKPRKSGGQG